VEIIAHRGASHAAPENTLAAARLAWTEGADALELDVQLTADAQLAVVHDENMQRLAGSPLIVSQATMAELQRLDVGRWKDPRFAGEKIPTLGEMLAVVPAGKRVFIEVKNGPEAVPPLESCLRNVPLAAGQIVVISFDVAAAATAKKALPHRQTAWILDYGARAGAKPSFAEIIRRCREASLDALDLSASWPIDRTVVDQVHRAGLKLYVWTVDDPAVARRLAEAGVDGIATNRPGWLRKQLAG
jgi:glycerophosphoryl diester phosphodiesterase